MTFPKLSKIEFFILSLLVILTIFLRTDRLEGKLTFEWDQERDMQAVEQMVTTHEPALLGPIVRGTSGGFYLGPAYYYSIIPLYVLSGGNPLSLAIVSVGADVLLVALLYLFLRKRTSILSAILIALIWACSPLLIKNAYTPWNVSWIPLWSLGFIWTLSRLHQTSRLRYTILLVFLASFTTNIHLSLVPLAGIFLLFNWRYFFHLTRSVYLWLLAAAIIPISTLIIHDLTHQFENTILLKRFLFGVTSKSASFLEIIQLIVEKFGYTIARIATGEPYTVLGLLILVILLAYGIRFRAKSTVIRQSLIIIAILLLSLVIYRDTDFAEYYFLVTFVPLMLLLAYFVSSLDRLFPKYWRIVLLPILCIYFVQLGVATRGSSTSPYSLSVKRLVVAKIRELEYPVEFRTNLPRERNTGFTYLLKDMGVVSDKEAPHKAYVYESDNLEVIAPEEARSIVLDQPIQAFKLVVFSN